MRHYKAVILPAMLGAALMVIPMPDAAAHDVQSQNYHGRPVLHIDYRRSALPRWLRQHNDFARWYRLNHAYLAIDTGWRRLYRRYQQDYFYHRHTKYGKTAKYQRRLYKGKRKHKRKYRK